MRDITKQVQSTISKLTRTVTIDIITDLGDGIYRLDTCCTYWLRPCKTITIDSVDYRIQSFVGATGLQGSTGATGLTGLQGSTGATGLTGFYRSYRYHSHRPLSSISRVA